MRTSLFFGLFTVALSIGSQTGWELSDDSIKVVAGLLMAFIVMDLVDFIKKL